MALVKKLMYFKSQSGFDEQLAAGNVAEESICFIKASETAPLADGPEAAGTVLVNKIWTHNQYFGDLTQAYSYIQKLQDEISNVATSDELATIKDALETLEKTVDGKQDTLTSANAGTGITITTDSSGNTVISATISATVDLSDYYNKSQTDSAISSAVAAAALTAGDNITISDNVISVSGFATETDINKLFTN